jgi:hypothetical protein
MFSIKFSQASIKKEQAVQGFVSLMEAVRVLDEWSEKARP